MKMLLVSYLSQQYHGMALGLDIANHHFSSAKSKWLAGMKNEFDDIVLKEGEGNPQAREEEGKLSLLSMERS